MAGTSILVVEDEFITATDLRNNLVELGYEVPAIVDKGEEAIRTAGELRPSLVVMDIGLAGKMNGIEAGKQIRERFGIPVIYLTAHSDESTFWGALRSEPSGYIIKPFEARQLKFSIEMALHRTKGEGPAGVDIPGPHGEGAAGGADAPVTGGNESPERARPPSGTLKKVAIAAIIIGVIVLIPLVSSFLPAGPAGETQYGRNVEQVREIAREYARTHTYLGVQTGQPGDVYVCLDMAKDVWNMIKTRGINAVIEVGNVKGNITTVADVNHAWVLAEVGP
ncbi:MAG TPA: response regulator, partial [Methanomicrobiales archaeon]|nr:response regulator [Methanomicrobiales archaeon]